MARERSQSVNLGKTLITKSLLSRAANSELEQESYYRLYIPAEIEGRQVLVARVGCWKDYSGNHKKKNQNYLNHVFILFRFLSSRDTRFVSVCACALSPLQSHWHQSVSIHYYLTPVLMPYLFLLFWRTRVVESSVSKAITLVVSLPK